ncbi:MAG: molybdopterin biosynthesis protein [Syntrophobacteraceae bacterium]|nr:molybdopterin biosynthesis protein [Syntrophobacteraceae bacterium]
MSRNHGIVDCMKTGLQKQMELIEKHLGGAGKAALAAGVTATSWSRWKAGHPLPGGSSLKLIEKLHEEALSSMPAQQEADTAADRASGDPMTGSVKKTKRNVYLKMKTLRDARAIWEERTGALRTVVETIPAAASVGRVTAKPIFSIRSAPHYHGAAMDGYAVRARDTYGAGDTSPVALRVGETARAVDTGDMLPEGTDAVIMIEDVENISAREIEIRAAAFPWQHVRKVGEDIVSGELLLPQNHVLRPADAGSLLAAGILSVEVFGKPKVFLQPTGDEIIPAEKAAEAKPGDIIEFNGAILFGMVEECGGAPTLGAIEPDEYESLKEALLSGTDSADVVLMMAGSSAGSGDFISSVIEEVGEVLTHGVAMMPGKPVILGMVNGKPVVGLPGYSVSAIMAFEQFVRPLLYSFQGTCDPAFPTISATLGRKLPSKLGLEEFARVILGRIEGKVVAMPLQRGAAIITSLTRADGILQIPQELEGVEEGAEVEIRLLRPKELLDYTLLTIGSHDNTIDLIANELKGRDGRLHLSSSNVGSLGGLMALRRGQAHFAGSHLLDTQTGEYNYSYVERHLKGTPVRIVQLAMREQGLILAKGNPKKITGIEDILRPDVVFINRQAGSGTRVLFDYSIGQVGLLTDQIKGYDQEEFTHMGVAIGVLSGRADTGMAIYSAARALDLDFIPFARERYDLVIAESAWRDFKIETTLEIVSSDSFRRKATAMGGYDVSHSGKVMGVWDGERWVCREEGTDGGC